MELVTAYDGKKSVTVWAKYLNSVERFHLALNFELPLSKMSILENTGFHYFLLTLQSFYYHAFTASVHKIMLKKPFNKHCHSDRLFKVFLFYQLTDSQQLTTQALPHRPDSKWLHIIILISKTRSQVGL